MGKQGMPHVPQLRMSILGSMHMSGVPHFMPPGIAEHGTQTPASHVALMPQLLPHVPQLSWSVVMSTQACFPAGPQSFSVPGQLQTPFWQAAPTAQVTPHMPQLVGSLLM
ncbi:MAG: hypothetical protein M3O36_13560 [Myxococcota bacterium]|nr:hypothetical protein [Myxococcota bacterium]